MSAATDLINELKILLVESTPLSEDREEGFQHYLTERKKQKAGARRAAEYLVLLFAANLVQGDERSKGLRLLRAQDDESLQRFFVERLPRKMQKRQLTRAMRGRASEKGVAKRARSMRAMLTMGGPMVVKAVFEAPAVRKVATAALEAAWEKDRAVALSILSSVALKSAKIRSWVRSIAGVSADATGKPYEVGVQGATAAAPTPPVIPGAARRRRSIEGLRKAKTKFASLPKEVRETKRRKYLAKMAGTLEGLQLALDNGLLTGSLRGHVRIAKKFINAHNTNFQPSVERMTGAIHDVGVTDIDVSARTKALESVLGKLVRKPKYKRADGLQDGTGMRVVCKSVQDVKKAVAGVKARYKVVDEDDYLDTPQGDYRSYHLIVEDDDGLEKEVQIRTANQHSWAEWFHDVYKPMTPEQMEAAEQNAEVLDDYAGKMSEYFWQVDQGNDPGPMPPCPQAVATTPFGCLS